MKDTDMDTLNPKSPIEKIHSRGMQAVIDGDNQKIIREVHPDMIEQEIKKLEVYYSDVGQDADGDIVFYREQD